MEIVDPADEERWIVQILEFADHQMALPLDGIKIYKKNLNIVARRVQVLEESG